MAVNKERYVYTVVIDRDQIPGWNHRPDDFEKFLQDTLDEQIGHYNPKVKWNPTLTDAVNHED